MNMSSDELVAKIRHFKPYYGTMGGVTFSGGEPLMQGDFLLDVMPKLKREGLHLALDTAGIAHTNIAAILEYTDLIIFDIKDITKERFYALTGGDIEDSWAFIAIANRLNKKFWLRQVIVPTIHDNSAFLKDLALYIKDHFPKENILKIEFLPYHKLGSEKYTTLNIPNPYHDMPEMDPLKCEQLYREFLKYYNSWFTKIKLIVII